MSTDIMQRMGGATLTGVGLAGQMVATNQAANAVERMASATQGAAQGQQDRAMEFAKPTTAELTQMGKQINSADMELTRKQTLMSTLDPTFMEAGRQALALLRGQQAASLGPMQQERDRQRNNLVQRMQSTMGPGSENSASGAEQLKQFDSQTALMMNDAQQHQIQTLLATTLSARPDIDRSIAALGDTMSSMNTIQQRQIGALERNSVIPYAGAQYAGDAYRAGAYMNMSKNVTNTGMQQWSQGTGGGGSGGGGGGMPGMGSMGAGGGGGGGSGMMAGGPGDAGGITGGGGDEMGSLAFA